MMTKQEMIEEICAENEIKHGYMIGDTLQDIQAGQATKLMTIAVSYGYESQEFLRKGSPTFVVHSFSEIIDIVNRKF